jgi:predicted deacylase
LKRHIFKGQTDGPHLLITGGVHGDEFEPIAAIRRLVDIFRKKSTEVAEFAGQVTLVPIVNEAAFLRGHRCADDGLDLARSCPGKADGTITERTADELSRVIRESDDYIDLHTGGTELSVHPLAGYMLHKDPDVLDVQRRMARAVNLPVVWGTSSEHGGRSLSVARDANVPAIYCEYLGSATCSGEGVTAYIDGCLNVMRELGMLHGASPSSRIEHLVEDARPASGHLQICHPSPVDGYFEPSVALGDRVEQGDAIGLVFDINHNQQYVINADHGGIVIVLRTFPRVRSGGSVGVILELPAGESPSLDGNSGSPVR